MSDKDIELCENEHLLSNKNGVTIFFKEKIDENKICGLNFYK